MSKNKKIWTAVIIIVSLCSTILNIPIVRELFGVVVTLFIPGFLLLEILEAKTSIILSVGLSLAIDIILMLGINFIFPNPKPISFAPVVTVFYSAISILWVIYSAKEEK